MARNRQAGVTWRVTHSVRSNDSEWEERLQIGSDEFKKSGAWIMVVVRRNRNYDVLRLVFATQVILAHTYGVLNQPASVLTRSAHASYNIGSAAVTGFFLLSGFLIAQSWLLNPNPAGYLRKRLVRIVPGYLVSALLVTGLIGWAAPGISHFFSHFDYHFAESIVLLGKLATPPVFPHTAFQNNIDESLWTIPYEFRCYIALMLLGIFGMLRRWIVSALVLILLLLLLAIPAALHTPWHKIYLITGEPWPSIRLLATFLIGAGFYLFRQQLVLRTRWAAIASALLGATLYFRPAYLEVAAMTLGAYITFYAGERLPFQGKAAWRWPIPDISFGVYLYGWPLEALWMGFKHARPSITFFASTVLAYAAGWLSWEFVERPMLKFKRGAKAAAAV